MNRASSTILTGLVLALGACTGEPSGLLRTASVRVEPDSVGVMVGRTVQLSGSARDADGVAIAGRSVSWSTSDPGRATVSPQGLVLGVTAGRVFISAALDGKRDSAVVTVTTTSATDFDLVDAQFTQTIQAPDGSVPMMLGGLPAVVNVLINGNQGGIGQNRLPVVLRLFNANGTLTRADTAFTGTIALASTYAAPSVQFLVPANLLVPAMQWQVELDPRAQLGESDRNNNLFPRTSRRLLATTSTPTLKVRFVPITMSAHNNSTVSITPQILPEYLRTLRSIFPLGAITTTISPAFTTAASFGTPPGNGGQLEFWERVLGELDVARIADPSDPETHWYGVIRPPTGFNFTQYGGLAYRPNSGSATGAGTRTAMGVAVGWFNSQSQARDLVAHELGHNFGRRHAPCGAAGNPDPLYPNGTGIIGVPGHDVFGWSSGASSTAITIDPGIGDIMGYCYPGWVSEYTYRGVLAFRGTTTAALVQPVARTNVLIVRGKITNGNAITIEPALTLEGRPTRPERGGSYMLEGRSADGRVLFTHNFEPSELDHAPHIRHFTFALEATPELESSLAVLEVRGASVSARLARPTLSAAARATPLRTPAGQRFGDEVVLRCADRGARAIAVTDASGALLGTARGAEARVSVAAGTPVRVTCSDGLRSVRSNVVS